LGKKSDNDLNRAEGVRGAEEKTSTGEPAQGCGRNPERGLQSRKENALFEGKNGKRGGQKKGTEVNMV